MADDDPWNLQRILDSLPHELQQLLSEIMRTCHSLCSDHTEAANAVTRDVHRLLLQLVAAIQAELESDPSSNLRTSSYSWHLLGRLVNAINHHFQERPQIMFVSEDADMQSAAAAARGIKACFTQFIVLLSSDEDRAANVASFTICLMDTYGDAETAMRFAFLDIISRRVFAVKQPMQRWNVTIDDEVRHTHTPDDIVSSGFHDVPTPFRKDSFDELECFCGARLFQRSGDDSVVLLARQLKCPTVVNVSNSSPMGHRYPHVMCEGCAQKHFIEYKHTACPHCRHNFQEHLCVDITAALQHQVHEDESVVWTAAPQRRLAALNVLAQLPAETPLSDSVAYGVLRSCLVAEADVAAAALRCGRLHVAIEVIPRAEVMEWFAQSMHARAAAAVIIAEKADIMTAAEEGDCDLVLLHLIADPTSANQSNDDGSTPLHWYCKEGRLVVCQLLVEKGADVNAKNFVGSTPLHASSAFGHLEVCQFLVEKRANVNATRNDGTTPLLWSSVRGNLEVCQFLVQKRANVNAKDISGSTPLIESSSGGHLEVCQFLVENGADVADAQLPVARPAAYFSEGDEEDVDEAPLASSDDD